MPSFTLSGGRASVCGIEVTVEKKITPGALPHGLWSR
jgi:hypothetical protein